MQNECEEVRSSISLVQRYCVCRVKVAEAEADQTSEYVKQIDELTRKLSDASSLITELQQQQVGIASVMSFY